MDWKSNMIMIRSAFNMKNWKKRMAAILSAGTLAMTGTVSALSGWSAAADATFSYGDALKMSLYF